MRKLKVALLQIQPGAAEEDNYRIGETACRRARERGADIALFPEMWSNGYQIPQGERQLQAQALPAKGPFVSAFGRLASELQMAIGITFLESYQPQPRNTIVLFDRHGNRALTYAKVHTCDFEAESRLTAGEDFNTAKLDTACGPVVVGAMICYDREFPESARILMLKGTEIILVPNACPMEINRLAQLRGRAYENMLGIATCNYPSGQPDCNGHSSAFDGVAYWPGINGSRDICILEAGEQEGVYIAEFDLDQMREYRRKEIHGNAYRRPKQYQLLTDPQVQEPFIRRDARR